ncbi:MAG: MBL fold metallo-hydrolase [Candidatus Saccharimonadales bacterium]
MDIQFYGANCVKLSSKKASVVIDDNLSDLGLKSITKNGDILLFTNKHSNLKSDIKLVIDLPGEYEVSDASIQGIAARGHMDEEKQAKATIYKIIIDDIRVVALGHIYPELSESQLEAIGTVDVLIVPVGGFGYTLDSVGALKLIKKIEPKIVIPTHYDDSDISYPVTQQSLEEALKGLAMEPKETTSKLRLKPTDLLDSTQLIILERQQ